MTTPADPTDLEADARRLVANDDDPYGSKTVSARMAARVARAYLAGSPPADVRECKVPANVRGAVKRLAHHIDEEDCDDQMCHPACPYTDGDRFNRHVDTRAVVEWVAGLGRTGGASP